MQITTIRPAGPGDAQILAAIGSRAFTETFGHLYSSEDLDAFLTATHSPERIAGELADPALAVWLAEAGEETVGYAVAGPCGLPHPEVTAACGEIKRIYVLKPWQGGLTGKSLMTAALSWLEAQRRRPVWLGVWSGNDRALAFYARRGFRKVGSYKFKVGKSLDHEFILRRG